MTRCEYFRKLTNTLKPAFCIFVDGNKIKRIERSNLASVCFFSSEAMYNRVVQKPRFLNNCPGKNREFAAMRGKFSGTWERTARFLNKSDN
jgi:hypothetical protein